MTKKNNCPDGFSPEDMIREAKKKALRLLEYSDRTEKQLRDKLEEGGFPPFAVDAAIEYAGSFHYIDDRRYAGNFIRNRSETKSRFELKHQLEERGISRDIIEEVMNSEEDTFSETDTVKKLFLKKYGSRDLTDSAVYQKAFRYFSSRGFRYEDIRTAMEEAVGEQENTDR